MPGVSQTVARVLLAEVGLDMTRFPTAGHLVSWAGLCPRLHEGAGKRRGPKKAILAVATFMLTASYHILKNGVDHHALGAEHFDRRDQARLARRLIRLLHDLGLDVEIRPAA
jgi:transposase